MARQRIIAAVIACAAIACAEKVAPVLEDVRGDWFRCATLACETLEEDGLRFFGEQRVLALRSEREPFEDGDRYCEAGNTFVLETELEVSGGIGVLRQGPTTSRYARVTESSDGPCSKDEPRGPAILRFWATPEKAVHQRRLTLHWIVERAAEIEITTAAGRVRVGRSTDLSGSMSIRPFSHDSTFKLLARGIGRPVSAQLNVELENEGAVVVTNTIRPTLLTISDDRLLWRAEGWTDELGENHLGYVIQKSALDGAGSAAFPFSAVPIGLRADADDIYLIEGSLADFRVLRIDWTGENQRVLAHGNWNGQLLALPANSIVRHGEYLYWTMPTLADRTENVALVRCPRDGSGPVEMLHDHLFYQDSLFGFAGDKLVYRQTTGRTTSIMMSNLDGSETTFVADTESSRNAQFAVDARSAFWTRTDDSYTTHLYRVDFADGAIVELTAEPLDGYANEIALDDEDVYVATVPGASGVLAAVPKSGGEPWIFARGPDGVYSVALTDDSVFFATWSQQGYSSAIMRAPK